MLNRLIEFSLRPPGARSAALEFLIKLLVRTDPNPKPNITVQAACYRTIVPRYTNRPSSRRIPYSFETQPRMGWIRDESTVGGSCRTPDLNRQITIHLPKSRCPAGGHAFSSKSLSLMIGNCAGSLRYASSISSRNFSSLGRGVGSRMIFSQRASPSSSGTKVGSDSTKRARSASGSCRIAAAISSTVLTMHLYNTRPAWATTQPDTAPC